MNKYLRKIKREKKYTSLTKNLVVWLLLISVVPLIIISFIGYQQFTKILRDDAAANLEQSSELSVSFIKNWFDYRYMDINNQAQSRKNIELLTSLTEGFEKSGKSLGEYVKSYDWSLRVDEKQNYLIRLSRSYDYIYDLFILDTKGNLLFTITREADLGTNMLTGPYEKSLFAKSIRKTLDSGKVYFSDMERYEPSKNIIAGFITSPLIDEYGNRIGVFAVQVRVNKIFDAIRNVSNEHSTLTHYLVGEDGILRSPVRSRKMKDVLTKKITTQQFKLWQKEHSNKHNQLSNEILLNDSMDEIVFEYLGPNGKIVLGRHQAINITGVNWVLVSEIDKDEAFAAVNLILRLVFITIIITMLLVTVWAIYQAKRITKPITQLVSASRLAADGKVTEHVKVDSTNEIAQLADVFNYMLDVRKQYEDELNKTTASAEKALSELSEQKFALDQHSIVAITDTKGNITFANKLFSKISGYSQDELIGQNHRILNSRYHDDSFFREMYRTISHGGVWHGEVFNRAKDGTNYWVDTTIVPFKDDSGKPKSYIAIRTDITERKKADFEILKAKEVAEAATQQKSEFLANMSHEIRTPMNGIIGMTGLLLDTNLNNKQRNFADSTMSSADALLSIINDILDFSKIEAGKMQLELLPFNLQSLMEDVSELMAVKCREKKIEMLLHFLPTTAKNVIGDPGRIRQILLNLLSNAIKFTEQGSIVLTVSSETKPNGRDTINVAVADSGIGIDDDKINKIFNKFDQEDGSTTRKYGGTGLGLSICRQLCNLMDGDIKVESHKGYGSVFTFNIELSLTDEETISTLQLGDISKLIGTRTLIVDDLEIAQTILTEQLTNLKLDIETASSGKSALGKLNHAISKNNPFKIVITDFHMPEMDGETFAAEIKKQKLLEEGALLFITSSPRKGDGMRLKNLGFDGYLTKPTRALEVPQIISIICNAKRSGKEIPLVTRHMVKEVKVGNKKKLKLNNTHILLAEDNPVNQMVATEYLERYGCSVSPAGNGLEAVTQMQESDFDLVFMDCQMPEMDGYEATGVIRHWENLNEAIITPIIAFTANAMQGDKEKCIAAGMDDYISKPVNEKALEDILVKWLPEKVQWNEFENDLDKPNKIETTKVSSDSGSTPPLNLSVFNTLKNMFGDAFLTAVNSHTNSAKENLNRIDTALDKNDASELEHAAHSLKGASGQFGAMVLSELAKEMETFGKEGAIDKAKEVIDDLKNARENAEKLMIQELEQ